MTLILIPLLIQDITNCNSCRIVSINLDCVKNEDTALYSKIDLKLKSFPCYANLINSHRSKE